MAEIKAFKGWRYNNIDSQKVITPPYDVIDNDYKSILQNRSEYNFTNLILNDNHEIAKSLLDKWTKNNILTQDKEDTIYIYEQEYDGLKRTGFICLLKIEDLGKTIMPHENTFSKHIEDRYDLMEKTCADFGQIFLIYEDKTNEIDSLLTTSDSPIITYLDDNNCTHKITPITNPITIKKITDAMSSKSLLIADGHHRYKTALRYSKEHGITHHMVTLVNGYNEGLKILPTNRLIRKDIDLTPLEEFFDITPITISNPKELDINLSKNSFIIAKKDHMIKATLKTPNKDLDIVILHDLIFKKILKPTDLSYPDIDFIKGNEQAIDLIPQGTMFFVNPPTLDETFAIAKDGKVMPQKSTYFYPKMFSGLVLNRWEEKK